jgi:hypothetical protein
MSDGNENVSDLGARRAESMAHAVEELKKLLKQIEAGNVDQVAFAYAGPRIHGGGIGGISGPRDQMVIVGLIESVKLEAITLAMAGADRREVDL